jgi:hypothetical protein
MQTISTLGLDIAKSVFQVHGVDAAGQVVIRRQLKRRSVLAFFQKLPVGDVRSWGTTEVGFRCRQGESGHQALGRYGRKINRFQARVTSIISVAACPARSLTTLAGNRSSQR